MPAFTPIYDIPSRHKSRPLLAISMCVFYGREEGRFQNVGFSLMIAQQQTDRLRPIFRLWYIERVLPLLYWGMSLRSQFCWGWLTTHLQFVVAFFFSTTFIKRRPMGSIRGNPRRSIVTEP